MIPVHLQIIAHDLTGPVLREQGDVGAVVTEGAPKVPVPLCSVLNLPMPPGQI
jgi:hypothetical protein